MSLDLFNNRRVAELEAEVKRLNDEIARKNDVIKMVRSSAEWDRDEHTRMAAKCQAIIASIRKLKGRGSLWRSKAFPTHNL